ncbi:hypothetical protein ACWDNT_16325, partial [Streptomyces sp. NPDC000963]
RRPREGDAGRQPPALVTPGLLPGEPDDTLTTVDPTALPGSGARVVARAATDTDGRGTNTATAGRNGDGNDRGNGNAEREDGTRGR